MLCMRGKRTARGEAMTEKQLDAIKALASRYNSDLDHTDVLHGTDDFGPHGLPTGWVEVVVMVPGEHSAQGNPHRETRVAVVAGVSPEGNVHT